MAAAAGLLALVGCAREPAPNLVLLSIDTLRADHLGVYGYRRDTSPNLDAFARRGAVFEHVYAPAAWTLPSHASMMTGLVPGRHGAVGGDRGIRDDVAVLAELLAAAGYRTDAVVNGPFVKAKFGFGRGFDSYVYFEKDDTEAHHDAVLRALRAGLARRPSFLFLHYMTLHIPHRPPPEHDRFSDPGARFPGIAENLRATKLELEAGRRVVSRAEVGYLRDLYDGEIVHLDAMLGEVFALLAAAVARDTYLVVTSDHGEEFLDHGSLIHNGTLYDELIHVPFLLWGPDVPAGIRVPALRGLVDVAPTLLELARVPAPPGLDGRSVLEAFGDAPQAERVLPLLTGYPEPERALLKAGVRTEEMKLIVDLATGARELYDLARDPEERRNVYPTGARRDDPRLEALERAVPAGAAPSSRDVQLTPEEREALRSLGYIE
jgi:arylsulfatase A-like enzyme